MAPATCSHLNVVFREAGWACSACDEPFIPRKRAAENQERNYQLLQAAASLAAGHLSRKDCEDEYLDEAIYSAEALLEQIETRNATHVPIRDSGF